MTRKIRNTILISVALVIMAGIIIAFYLLILFTPNLNSYIYMKSSNVLGTITVNIKNAKNGSPYTYFPFENTTLDVKEKELESKNLLFYDDELYIEINFTVNNMSHYKAQLDVKLKGPGKNADLQILINEVEVENLDTLILEPNSITDISFVISKINVKKPIRSNFTVDMVIFKYEP